MPYGKSSGYACHWQFCPLCGARHVLAWLAAREFSLVPFKSVDLFDVAATAIEQRSSTSSPSFGWRIHSGDVGCPFPQMIGYTAVKLFRALFEIGVSNLKFLDLRLESGLDVLVDLVEIGFDIASNLLDLVTQVGVIIAFDLIEQDLT